MTSTRRRRIRIHHELARAEEAHRRRLETARAVQIQRFDEALAKFMVWVAVAVCLVIAIVLAVA